MVERVSGRGAADKREAPAARAPEPQGGSARRSAAKSSASKPKRTLPAQPRAASSAPSPARATAPYTKKTIALVYDFDGTLSPKPMQEYSFLPKLGISAHDFWAECTRVARAERADPLITYMHLMYKKAKEKGLRIDRADLVAQGKDVELYPGVEQWFDEIANYVAQRSKSAGITIKHYLVSSGLTEIIEGTSIYSRFSNVFASEYWFEAYDLPFPKRVITDTGKTQYLFRINKGIEDTGESINSHMAEDARPIPFANMIYFGDGDTDVPSMALLKKNGGHAIAVHSPPSALPAGAHLMARSDSPSSSRPERARGDSKSAQAMEPSHSGLAKCIDLFRAGRCDFYAAADYRRGSDLFKRTCLLLDRMLADIRVQEERAGLG